MKNSKTFVRVVALMLALIMTAPFFASCSDKEKGNDNHDSDDTKVNTLTGVVGADLMEGFWVDLWSEEPYMFGLELSYTDPEGKEAKTFEEFENLLEEEMMLQRIHLRLKEHAKTYNKSLKKISFTIEADRDVDLYFDASMAYRLEDRVFQEREKARKSVSLEANKPTEIELVFDMEDTLSGEGDVCLDFQQDASGEVLTDTWDEWHLTKYKITDFKVIMK